MQKAHNVHSKRVKLVVSSSSTLHLAAMVRVAMSAAQEAVQSTTHSGSTRGERPATYS